MSPDEGRAVPPPGTDRVTAGDPHFPTETHVVPAHGRSRVGGASEPNGLFVGPMDDTDRFELVGLGLVGGEGVTWCGRYTGRLHHPVTYAIKQIQPPPPRSSSVWPTRSDMRRWLDQRFLLQTVTNDHLVRLVDVFLGPPPHRRGDVQLVPDGVEFATPYLVMEWVAGLTVAERVERRLDPIGVRVQWVLHIAEALDALHSYTRTSGNPMLHCDVKPDNCIVHPERGAVLVDVGALRGLDDGVDSRGLHTERYAAPEVLADATAPRSTASDLYGLGALAYFCLVQDDPPAATRAGRGDDRTTPGCLGIGSAPCRAGVAGDHGRDRAACAPHREVRGSARHSRRGQCRGGNPTADQPVRTSHPVRRPGRGDPGRNLRAGTARPGGSAESVGHVPRSRAHVHAVRGDLGSPAHCECGERGAPEPDAAHHRTLAPPGSRNPRPGRHPGGQRGAGHGPGSHAADPEPVRQPVHRRARSLTGRWDTAAALGLHQHS